MHPAPEEHAPEGHTPERHAPEGHHDSSISAVERSLIFSIIENILLIIYRIFMSILLFIIHTVSYITHELLSSPGIKTSPYYLSASILVDEKYEPIFKFLLVELSPVITILYPIISYMLPYDILKSLDDDLAITILSPVILHIKKPEYHYQGITDSMVSIVNSSYKLFNAHYYGITEEEEKKIVESPMFKKMKYEIELDEDFVHSIDISYMIPESLMNTYQRYAEPEEMDRIRESRTGEPIAEIVTSYPKQPVHRKHPISKRSITIQSPSTYRLVRENSIVNKASVKIGKNDILQTIQETTLLNPNNFEPWRLIYAIVVFPIYIVTVIPLNFILYSSLAISTVYLLGQQWYNECITIHNPIKRRQRERNYKLRIIGLSAFFGTMLCLAPIVLFFMGFKAVYIAITESIENCIYFSFKMAVGYSPKEHHHHKYENYVKHNKMDKK